MKDLLREIALAGPEHLDIGYVAAYDRKAGFDPTADLAALRGHGLGASSTLIDFGAGTGTFAVAAARLCRRVVAVDVSPAMVEAIRTKVAATGVTNVRARSSGSPTLAALEAKRPASSTRGTPCTTFPTSGRA